MLISVFSSACGSSEPEVFDLDYSGGTGETVDLEANDWEDVDLEFTVPKSYTGKYVRIIFLGLGKSPDGTVYEISDVKLEKEVK